MSGSVLVLGDSLSYYGLKGGLPANDPTLWPNIVGERLEKPVELFARIGWTSRDVWWAVTQDPRLWQAMATADVIVFAVGGMDSLPSPVPTAFREQIRYIRPNKLRQIVRDSYSWVQPRLSGLGWPMALPPSVTIEYCEKVRDSLAQLRPELPFVVCLPPTHDSPYYGHAHPGHSRTFAAMRAWAAEHSLPTVSFHELTADAFADPSVEMNPDGIHWGPQAHHAAADLVTPVVRALV